MMTGRPFIALATMVLGFSAADLVAAAPAKDVPAKQVAGHAFGTITKQKRIPGDQVAKGDCRSLIQGGYMKFDLSEYPADMRAKSAELRVHLEGFSGNAWRWVSLISTDPTTGNLKTVFQEIEKHGTLLSGIVTLQKSHVGNWVHISLNKRALQHINAKLAKKPAQDRWIAMSLGFE